MKDNILILCNKLNGLYSFRKEVVQALIDAGYNVHLSFPDADSSRVPFFKEMGCHIDTIPFNRRGMNPLADIKLFFSYCWLIHKLKPKALLTYTIKPNVYGGIASRVFGVPLLANVTGLGDAIENGGLLQKLTIFLYRTGISKAFKTFFQNSSNYDFCTRCHIAGESVALLPGSGVNLQHHSYQSYPEDSIIKILYIGRIMKDKGSSELLEAVENITRIRNNVEFLVVGSVESEYQSRFDEMVSKGIVQFLGHTDDVRPYIGKAHCTIMPSYHEGMSNVNLESAANGRPVITTDIPGCRETVDDCKTGFLVKARDAKSLIDGIERFLALPYEQKKQMGIEARKKVEREFDRNIVVKAYLDTIKEI